MIIASNAKVAYEFYPLARYSPIIIADSKLGQPFNNIFGHLTEFKRSFVPFNLAFQGILKRMHSTVQLHQE